MSMVTTAKAPLTPWLQGSVLHVAACLCAVGGADLLEDYSFFAVYLTPFVEQWPELTSYEALDRHCWQGLQQRYDAVESADQRPDFAWMRLKQAGLTIHHFKALLLAGLVEVDARLGTVYSVLHPLPEERRLTVGLLGDLLQFNAEVAADSIADEPGAEVAEIPTAWEVVTTLEQRGLITRHYGDRPRASQALTVPGPVWDALWEVKTEQPAEGIVYRAPDDLERFETLAGLLPEDLLKQLQRLPTLVNQGLTQGVILRGMRGTGRLRAVAAMAHVLGSGLLHIQRPELKALPQLCRLAGALAMVQGAIPVIELELSPGETVALPSLAGYGGLFAVLLNQDGSLSGAQVQRCVTLSVSAPDRAARQQQWQQVVGAQLNGSREAIEQASQRYHLTLGAVQQVGQMAKAYGALAARQHLTLADVEAACRSLNQQTLENLATRMTTHGDWHRLIVAEGTRGELETLLQRCRHRETLLDHLGVGFAGTTRGVRALFSGASGTGKTLAARLVAGQLGLDLYRVDLSAVVSKYIGETERNLSRLFARAEEQDIMLLLDEGDALLTARTDVRSSNDRYANMETNYLLQRLEHYEGIILITSNASKRIDGAFQRRIDVVIEFEPPEVRERQKLWALHLPENHGVSEELMQRAAIRCELTGGQIRNAALHATLLAVEENLSVSDGFMVEGIQREYTKMGAASPLR